VKKFLSLALFTASFLLPASCSLENNAADEYEPGKVVLAVKNAGIDAAAVNVIPCCQRAGNPAKNVSDGDWRTQWNADYGDNAYKYGHQKEEAEGGDGNHWITLDLGEHRNGIVRLKYQGVWDWYNGSIRQFEVYISDDIEKLGHFPDPAARAPVKTDRWSFTEWYGRNDDADAVRYAEFLKGDDGNYPSGRYVQLRSLDAEATDDPRHNGDYSNPPWKFMSAAEMSVDFLGDFTESDKRELSQAYARGLTLLNNSDKASIRVQSLITALDAAKELLAVPEPAALPAALAFQGEIDRCTGKIIQAIYAVSPPPKPLEY
jgi:hypothetical protein